MIVFQNPPFIQYKKQEHGVPRLGNDRFEGFCIDMIEKIAEKCNFTYTIRERTDGVYGANENGTWNGMIGEVIREVGTVFLNQRKLLSFRFDCIMLIRVKVTQKSEFVVDVHTDLGCTS